jgi:hypothetical protein
MPMIKPRTFNLEGALDPIILLDPPLDAPGQYTLLSAIKLCVCDAQHRHFLPTDTMGDVPRRSESAISGADYTGTRTCDNRLGQDCRPQLSSLVA